MIKFCEICNKMFENKSNEKECSVKCRFLNRIEITEECWIWKGNLNLRSGYGLIRDGLKTKLAHRLSYEIFKGSIENRKCVCHSCDNKLCVNPFHLWVGSYSDNIQDALFKKRWNPPIGDANGKSVLTTEDVMEIKKLISEKVKQKIIAEKFNIDQSTVSDIKRRKRWKHL